MTKSVINFDREVHLTRLVVDTTFVLLPSTKMTGEQDEFCVVLFQMLPKSDWTFISLLIKKISMQIP